MTISVSREQETLKRVRAEIEKKTGKTPEELYEEREKRVSDAIALKVPDRVPVCLRVQDFPLKYAGLQQSALFYDPAAYREAVIQTLVDLEPDTYCSVGPAERPVSGHALAKLGSIQYLWPGGPLRPDQTSQFLDMAIMKADEYDLFITDPGDFILRYWVPREWKALAALAKLPPLMSLLGSSALASQSARFSSPEIVQAFQVLFEAGRIQAEAAPKREEIGKIVGIPDIEYPGGVASQPAYDVFVNYLRGLNGTSVDMFKRPEKLLRGMERVFEYQLARASGPPTDPKRIRVQAGSNHFMSEEFLSKKQFEAFPWPTWKKTIQATIDLGYIAHLYMQGKNDDRLDLFLDFPKGKVFMRFAQIDIVRAKEILGGHMCIIGGVPGSLMWGGSPSEVEEYCKNIIKVCGKDGGFILSCNNTDDAKPANIKAMIDSVKKYGWY